MYAPSVFVRQVGLDRVTQGNMYMKARMFVAVAAAVALFSAAVIGADPKLDGVKCVVAGNKDAKATNSVDYKGAKVFFCCQNCPKAFKEDTAKFAASANHQLVATGQAEQVKCPFTGGPINADTAIEVKGARVAFCCEKCQGKAKESKEQVELIFNDKAFEKGFKVSKSE
jgi:YHS domain-containing protein